MDSDVARGPAGSGIGPARTLGRPGPNAASARFRHSWSWLSRVGTPIRVERFIRLNRAEGEVSRRTTVLIIINHAFTVRPTYSVELLTGLQASVAPDSMHGRNPFFDHNSRFRHR